ncbi:hypothetical protein FisN_14Hh318 [Fistulifera solaris]|uniref:RecQ-mediated genome instability protein 1 n=1 Tax=Fistulifera solaris TaxID=1519565 RepID=A0A1Z5KC76_FISSO|nr:hypothetical protein FisN_14Hh318 [Fistulifera solaris]|eukprot:GAX23508.1 hypothetical protein FisN_14Hh318 [Fistulifera solaris]
MLDVTLIRQQLLEFAGVSPSSHWLEDCRAALQVSGQEQITDSYLHQILYHDLRDVVRELDEQENYGPLSEVAIALRQAQAQSMQASHQYKALLPSSFRLLVQLEEILDVSVNAQARYENGPASNASPTPVGNQQKRCLKMVYSDGYDSNEILVATETSPIPSLSVQSRAGCKVILMGPIQLRHGMALWNSTTTLVLGGEVEALVQIQKAAIEQAKRVAGVGIDPTIKALIWNNQQPIGEDGEPQDEAEFESRDLPPSVPPTLNTGTGNGSSSMQTMNGAQHSNLSRPGLETLPTSRASSRSTSPVPLPSAQIGRPLSHAPPQQPASNNSTGLQNFTTQSNRSTGSTQSRNPYASNHNNRHGHALKSTNTSPVPSSNSNNYVDLVDLTDSVESSHGTNDLSEVNTNGAVNTPLQMTTNVTSESIPYNQLLEIIQLAIRDPEAYRRAFGMTWNVELQQVGTKDYFNIEKRKNRAKGDEKKHEYVVTAKFKCPGDGIPISFKIDSATIVEPYFQLSPSDMRQLRKDDKERANTLVRDGGKLLQADMYQLRLYQVSLLLSPEEFFQDRTAPATLDGPTPLLLLAKKKN